MHVHVLDNVHDNAIMFIALSQQWLHSINTIIALMQRVLFNCEKELDSSVAHTQTTRMLMDEHSLHLGNIRIEIRAIISHETMCTGTNENLKVPLRPVL
jgi:hypothetical protein